MFSPDVKRLCFRRQTLRFPRPNLSLRDLKRLCFSRFQVSNFEFSSPNVKFSRQSRCSRGSLSLLSSQSRNLRKTCENHWYGEAKKHWGLHLGGETSKFDSWNIDVWRQLKTCFWARAFKVRCNRRYYRCEIVFLSITGHQKSQLKRVILKASKVSFSRSLQKGTYYLTALATLLCGFFFFFLFPFFWPNILLP